MDLALNVSLFVFQTSWALSPSFTSSFLHHARPCHLPHLYSPASVISPPKQQTRQRKEIKERAERNQLGPNPWTREERRGDVKTFAENKARDDEQMTAQQSQGPKLRFCPESSDLLSPVEDKERKQLVYYCRGCGYKEDAAPSDWCVFRNEVHHTSREKAIVLQDVRSDPTLPRTNEVRCPSCGHTEAVFFSASTEEGMTLFFNCTGCAHRWRDHV
jgi:DNA-directed RNA polymerase II subunit RPB9